MEGEAIQNDMTGARGTPPSSREAMTGITPQEQKGLKAPSTVARKMDIIGFPLRLRCMIFETLLSLMITARGMVISR